jgi:hypothetical protein
MQPMYLLQKALLLMIDNFSIETLAHGKTFKRNVPELPQMRLWHQHFHLLIFYTFAYLIFNKYGIANAETINKQQNDSNDL